MSMADYTSHIKEICDSLASINVTIEEDDMVYVCLGGFALKFVALRMAICMRENKASFFDLQSMLLVEENHVGALIVSTLTARCCTQMKIGPMVVVDESSRHATGANDNIKTESTEAVSTTVLEPSEARGVKVVSETGKESLPQQNAGIVARKDTKKASVGRSAPIQTNPDLDLVEPNKEIDNGRTTSRALKEAEMDRTRSS